MIENDERPALNQNDCSDVPPVPKDKFKSTLRRWGTKISNAGKSIASNVETRLEAHSIHVALNEKFEREATEFTIGRSQKVIHAIKNMDEQRLYIRVKDAVIVGDILASSSAGAFDILESSAPTEYDYPLDSSSPYPIKVYQYRYETHRATPTPTIHNNQTVNITGNNTVGDIILTQKTDLDGLKSAINNYKPSLFTKRKHEQVIEMYGKFETCVLNGKKDQTLFKKFLSLLQVILPTAATIAVEIINSLH